MRIQRLDVEGFGRLSGGFVLPRSGLALWTAPNEAGKSTLLSAVTTALYGADPDAGPEGASGWIQLTFTRDDGETLRVSRDFGKATARVMSQEGDEVTERFRNGAGEIDLGTPIFGLTRGQFREAFRVPYDGLHRTVGDPTLRSFLAEVTPAEARDGSPLPPPPPLPEAPVPPPPRPATAPGDDIRIFRNATEEMQYFSSGELPGSGALPETGGIPDPGITIERGDVHANIAPTTAPGEEPPEEDDPDEAGIGPVACMRRLRARLARLDHREAVRKHQLARHAEAAGERSAEAQRLSSLAGAEPQDVDEILAILTGTREIDDAKARLFDAEARYHARLEKRGIPAHELQLLAGRIRALSEEQLEFVRNYRQAGTIRRGTRALTRSEQRLDDSRMIEIREAQERAARQAMFPLAFSMVGLFGSIAFRIFPVPLVPPAAALSAGFAAAILGALLLHRARRLRVPEHEHLSGSQERKRAQMEQLDEEDRQATSGLELIAETWNLPAPEGVLEQYDTWEAHSAELEELDDFARRTLELEHESAALREKLGRFAAAQGGTETTDTDLIDPDSVYNDYVRHFELRAEIDAADHKSLELEAGLADLEMDRADCRGRIEELLLAAGIDPDRDIDEAVEMFALRADPEAPGFDSEASPETADGNRSRVPEIRISSLSARVEAVLRRFLPDVRNVELDDDLSLRLRFDAQGPMLGMADLAKRLSGGSLDQVCLALRLAIVETPSPSGERIPVFLDDPLVRADDMRHDRALEFLVEDASERGQVVLLTAQEVRVKWFLHQFPKHRDRITSIVDTKAARASSASVPSPSQQVSSSTP